MALAGWLVFCVWVVGYAKFHGYAGVADEPVDTTLGMPRWIFWGVAVPWIFANVFTIWFCLSFMKNDQFDSESDTPGSP